MIQLNLIKDLLYSSINGEKDLGLGRNYEGIQHEEPIFLNLLKSVSKCLVGNFLRAGVLNFVKLL